MNNLKVAIVIVNYNGYGDTHECVQSIEAVSYNKFDVIIVDNASSYNDSERLKMNFPNVTVIESPQNLGFTGGNNIGILKAYEIGVDYIFCLNNDTIVSENILDELVGFMEENQEVGLVGPVTRYYDNRETVAFAGGFIDRNTGLIKFVHKNTSISGIKEEIISCNFIEGAALFIRSALMKEIGGFNDSYFLTSEESELCIKIADLGYKLAVLSSCSVWHKVSKSMVAASELSCYFIFRNKLFFVANNRNRCKVADIYHIIKYYLICLMSFAFKKRNYAACMGLITGVLDFLRGVTGPGRYKSKLQG
jgi:GT2 family glycosyltransferase